MYFYSQHNEPQNERALDPIDLQQKSKDRFHNQELRGKSNQI